MILLFLLLPTLCFAGPNSVPPVEVKLQKIVVKPQEAHNPQDYQAPQSFKTEQEAIEYQKANGGMIQKVLGKYIVIGIKKDLSGRQERK